MDQMGETYLEEMDEVDPEVRITLIDPATAMSDMIPDRMQKP